MIEIFSRLETSETSHVLNYIHEGNIFGEIAFLDGLPRSASAKSFGETQLFILNKEKIAQETEDSFLLYKLVSRLAVTSSARLRKSTTDRIEALEKQLKLVKLQNQFGQFFIYILVSYTIASTMNALIDSYLSSVNIYTKVFNWSYLMLLLIPSLITVKKMGIPLEEIGLTKKNWKRSLKEGLIASVGFVALFVAVVFIAKSTGIIAFKSFSYDAFRATTYFFHSCLQEFMMRGVIQSSFVRFLNDQSAWKSIFLTSILFGLTHSLLGIPAILITLVASLGLGWFYNRHQNLIGVSILHGFGGMALFGFRVLS